MRTLALDLATNTGFAFNDDKGAFHCGTWSLDITKQDRKQRLNRRNDPRVTQLFNHVQVLHTMYNFDVLVIEDVEFQTYTLQCQLWSSLRAAAWLGAASVKFFEAVPVGTLKKFATGHGGATKSLMARALTRQDSRFLPIIGKESEVWFNPEPTRLEAVVIDDNAVDAVWLWKWAKNFLRMKP
jgi:Holliday junction resolvasome RuvABC endonuclease subunit